MDSIIQEKKDTKLKPHYLFRRELVMNTEGIFRKDIRRFLFFEFKRIDLHFIMQKINNYLQMSRISKPENSFFT